MQFLPRSMALVATANTSPSFGGPGLQPDVVSGPSAGGRARRVEAVLAGVVCLSVLDLGLTAQAIVTTGLFEANPIARAVLASGAGLTGLVLLKVAAVGLSTGLLHALRRHRAAEVGAWAALFVLSLVAVSWVGYLNVWRGSDLCAMQQSLAGDPTWVRIRSPEVHAPSATTHSVQSHSPDTKEHDNESASLHDIAESDCGCVDG